MALFSSIIHITQPDHKHPEILFPGILYNLLTTDNLSCRSPFLEKGSKMTVFCKSSDLWELPRFNGRGLRWRMLPTASVPLDTVYPFSLSRFIRRGNTRWIKPDRVRMEGREGAGQPVCVCVRVVKANFGH